MLAVPAQALSLAPRPGCLQPYVISVATLLIKLILPASLSLRAGQAVLTVDAKLLRYDPTVRWFDVPEAEFQTGASSDERNTRNRRSQMIANQAPVPSITATFSL